MSPRQAREPTIAVDVRLDTETIAHLKDIAKAAATTPETVAAVMLALFVRRETSARKAPAKKAPAKAKARR